MWFHSQTYGAPYKDLQQSRHHDKDQKHDKKHGHNGVKDKTCKRGTTAQPSTTEASLEDVTLPEETLLELRQANEQNQRPHQGCLVKHTTLPPSVPKEFFDDVMMIEAIDFDAETLEQPLSSQESQQLSDTFYKEISQKRKDNLRM